MYVLMCSEICLYISLPHPHTSTYTFRALSIFWRARYVQQNTKVVTARTEQSRDGPIGTPTLQVTDFGVKKKFFWSNRQHTRDDTHRHIDRRRWEVMI